MRDLKGDWRDIFNGFMLALDLRKMFLALCGIVFTVVGVGAVTAIIGNAIDPEYVKRPAGFLLHEVQATVCQSWHVIFSGTPGHPADWKICVPYSIFAVLALIVIWSYFGGAISRIAAYEIAKDGERIETAKALKFSAKKFWSFFWAPLICVIGFAFFFLCNFLGGAIGKVLDIIPYVGIIGAPLVSILLPLAILSGFIMTLILLGTVAGSSLFAPAVAAEGTDSFDAVSRGFSYVYSRPWHFIGYQALSAVYGYICIAFVILFAITMCHIGIKAGAAGFDIFGVWQRDHYDHIADASWGTILSQDHEKTTYHWTPQALVTEPHPYGRLQYLSICIVRPDWNWTFGKVGHGSTVSPSQRREQLQKTWQDLKTTWEKEKDPKNRSNRIKENLHKIYQYGLDSLPYDRPHATEAFLLVDSVEPGYSDVETHLKSLGFTQEGKRWTRTEAKAKQMEAQPDVPYTSPATNPAGHKGAAYILTAWLIVILGLALGYPVSYFFSQQTLIYFILRKKVDGIEMNEVFEETEDEERMPEPIAPPKPSETSPAPPPPPVAPPSEGKAPEGPKP